MATATEDAELLNSQLQQSPSKTEIFRETIDLNGHTGTQTNGQINKTKKTLKCMTLNAQSLNRKMDELKKMVRLTKPHIIGITETWGKEKINDAYFKIDNYTMYRNDREGKRGGGTILYITNQLRQRDCKTLHRPLNGISFDSSVWCWVTPTKGNTNISR